MSARDWWEDESVMTGTGFEPFKSKAMTRNENRYRGPTDQDPMLPGASVFERDGADNFAATPFERNNAETRFAGDALNGIAQVWGSKEIAEGQAEAAKARADAERDANQSNAIGGIVGGIASVAGAIFCDIRLKHDIAPLRTTEVNDRLARAAFQVQQIREHC